MIAYKQINKIITALMAFAVCLCLAAAAFPADFAETMGRAGNGGSIADTGITMEYETKLFDTENPVRVNIIMEGTQWEEMLKQAAEEQYYPCDVEIEGETFHNVGIRPKGNTSLTSIASNPDTDRFSLKLEFDRYVDGQSCFGLDKLILNNNYADATNMKEALIYDMYQYIGADASLYNYAELYVNGEYWGLYLALEAVEDSFLLRNYGVENGSLYKPDNMEMGGSRAPKDFEDVGEEAPPEEPGKEFPPQPPEPGEREDFREKEKGGGRPSMGGNGANLNYIDDDLESYSAIWEGEVTDTSESDRRRVVEALKNISEGTNIEAYMDIDNLLKYMAVHVFSVNQDSLSGNMAHNYYLYESVGRLNILPWDYNLALGGMGGMGGGGDFPGDNTRGQNSAADTVNSAIDNAFAGTEFFDALMENEEYHARYYAYLQQLTDEYLLGDGFEEFYNRTRSRIDSLVETDPTAFYTYEEYEAAAETLYEVVKLRGQSIEGQLNGTIPSVESEQKNSDALIDASHIDLSIMGTMNTTGTMGGGGGRRLGGFHRETEAAKR